MADSTDVRIVISAITEAAQDALDNVGDELNEVVGDAEITDEALEMLEDELSSTAARAVVAEQALDELGEEAADATITTQALKQAQDSLGDEFTETAAKATAAAGGISASAAAASGAGASFTFLNTTLLLSFIPTLLTLATVLAPLVVFLGALAAGAAALAAAFGLVIGSGILAFGQERAEQNQQRLNQINSEISALEQLQNQRSGLTQVQQRRLKRLKEEKQEVQDATTATGALQQQMSDLKDEIVPLIADFGESFIPLIEDATEAIPGLVEESLNATGSMDEFKTTLRDFGALFADVLPGLIGLLFDLARIALPVLESFVQFLQNNGKDALGAMEESVAELEPELSDLLDALIEMGPVLLEFGTNVAEIVIPALTFVTKAATQFMETVNKLPDPLQDVIISILLITPLIVKFGSALLGLLPTAFQLGKAFQYIVTGFKFMAGVISSTTAIAAAVGLALGLIVTKGLDMLGVFGTIRDGAAQMGNSIGNLMDHMLTLVSVLSLGLIPALGALGGIILGVIRGDLGQGVENAKQILGEFADAFHNTIGAIIGFFQDIADTIMDFIGNSIIIDILVDGLEHFTDVFIRFFTETLPGIVFGFMQDVAEGFLNLFVNTLPSLAAKGIGLFVAVIEGLMNTVFNTIAGIWNRIIDVIAGATEGLINTAVRAINAFLSTLDTVADTVSAIPGTPDINVGTLTEVDIGGDGVQADMRETDFGTLRERRTEQAQQFIQGGINVAVDTAQFGQNPRKESRTFATQLRRELRNEDGTT